jgi:hypothetical protein
VHDRASPGGANEVRIEIRPQFFFIKIRLSD